MVFAKNTDPSAPQAPPRYVPAASNKSGNTVAGVSANHSHSKTPSAPSVALSSSLPLPPPPTPPREQPLRADAIAVEPHIAVATRVDPPVMTSGAPPLPAPGQLRYVSSEQNDARQPFAIYDPQKNRCLQTKAAALESTSAILGSSSS